MKQCPQCGEHFRDEQNFCDADGTPLLDETAVLRNALSAVELPAPAQTNTQSRQIWPIVTIGVLIGVIISLSTYVIMVMPARDKDGVKNSRSEAARLNTSDTSTRPATVRSEPVPVPTAEASPEETASETASPTPEAVPEPSQPSVSLNNGPISTNRQEGEKRGRTIIKLKSGVSVEADAAWEDRLGIWYRQGGLVSYVERERIESIGEPARPKSSPTDVNKP